MGEGIVGIGISVCFLVIVWCVVRYVIEILMVGVYID